MIYDVDLDDGRTVTLEADSPPSEQDIYAALQSYQPPKSDLENLATGAKAATELFGTVNRALTNPATIAAAGFGQEQNKADAVDLENRLLGVPTRLQGESPLSVPKPAGPAAEYFTRLTPVSESIGPIVKPTSEELLSGVGSVIEEPKIQRAGLLETTGASPIGLAKFQQEDGKTVLETGFHPVGEESGQPGVALPSIYSLAISQLPEGTVKQMGAGAHNALASFVNFFGSPQGWATLGTGSLPRWAQRAVTAKFASDMLRSAPEQFMAGADALDHGDIQGATENWLGGVGSTIFAGALAKHTIQPFKLPSLKEPPSITKAGETYASPIRSDTGQILEAGQIPETSENVSGQNLQLAPPGQPQPVVPRVEQRPQAEVLPPIEPPKIAAKNYGDILAEEVEAHRRREEETFKRKQAGLAPKPKESLSVAVKRLGRDKIDELIGEWDRNAHLSEDGKFITTFSDPRNQTGKVRASSKEFMSWLAENEKPIEPSTPPAPPSETAAVTETPVSAEPKPISPEAKTAPTIEPKAKEPWEMTQDDFIDNNPSPQARQDADFYTNAVESSLKNQRNRPGKWDSFESMAKKLELPNGTSYWDVIEAGKSVPSSSEIHRASVERALREGKPVSPEVLADYPELKGKEKAVESVPLETSTIPKQAALRDADNYAGKLSNEAEKAVVAWATHVENVINPLKERIRKIQSEVFQMGADAKRTLPETKGKSKLTKKAFLEQYGVNSMDEANALYKQKNSEWADLEKQLEAAESKRRELEIAKERRGREWSAAATRASELRKQLKQPTPASGSVGDFRARLRSKQDEVIAIAERRNLPEDVPISEVQVGAPTIADLRKQIYPDFESSIDSFLKSQSGSVGSVGEIKGMGGAVPEEFKPIRQTATGIKNAKIDEERQVRGVEPLLAPARLANSVVWDRTMAKIDADPGWQDRLIQELKDKPRVTTPEETLALDHRYVDLQNTFAKTTRDLAQAYDDAKTFPERQEAVDQLKVQQAALSDQLLEFEKLTQNVGTEWGRSGQIRQRLLNEDYSLAAMEMKKRAANGGRPLTDAERGQITKLQARIDELQKMYDAAVAANKVKQTMSEVDSILKETKQKVSTSKNKTSELVGIDKTKEKIGTKLQNGELADVTGLVQKLVRAFVEENPKITRDELVGQVHEVLKEFIPDIEIPETRDAISGYGKYKQLKKDQISLIVRDLKGQLQQIGKLEDMAAGEAPRKTGIERRIPSTEERTLIKQVEEAKRKGGYKITDPATQLRTAMQAVKTRLTNQITDLETQIATRQKILKTKTRLEYDETANSLKARRDELKKQFDEIFPREPITDAQRLENWKKRTLARIEELNQKLANRDFSKKAKRLPPPMDANALRIQSELYRAKQGFNRGLLEDRLKDRPWWAKSQDTFLRWYRGGILSSPVVFAKLTVAAMIRAGITPIEEAIGSGYSKAFPRLAAQAPREGYWNSRAEAKAITTQLTKGPRDAWDILTKGETELDILYGKGREGAVGESNVRPFSLADIPGRTHGAWKASTKRAEFERSLEKRLTYAIRNGADASNPGVQLAAAVEAYKDANRSIFLQDNRVVSAYQSALSRFEQPSKITGKATPGGKTAATVARTLIPIVRVPSNIVAEAFQFATGSITGSTRLARAYAKGIESLPPEQADLIMRELKKGSIGTAALLVGYFLPQTFGGYFQRGEKRDEQDIKAGGARISDVNISSKMMHHPVFEAIQVGATVRRVSESETGQDQGALAIPYGVMAATLGLIEVTPFVREMIDTAKAFNPSEQDAYFGELAKSITEPQLLQWIAKRNDLDISGEPIERKPKTFAEHLKMGVPGLRTSVPEK